jgi:hypothetical protein
VLEHLIYKWKHFKFILKNVLTEKYFRLAKNGWLLDLNQIKKDVSNLLCLNFESFVGQNGNYE